MIYVYPLSPLKALFHNQTGNTKFVHEPYAWPVLSNVILTWRPQISGRFICDWQRGVQYILISSFQLEICKSKSYLSLCLCIVYKFHFIFISIVSENESAKGSADCLPMLNYQNSASIVRLNAVSDSSANKIPGEGTGELNSIHLLCAE
jgi:hypothetical protein